MTNCPCICPEPSKGKVCEYVPKCTDKIKVNVGIDKVGSTVTVFLSKEPLKKGSCISENVIVDIDGYAAITPPLGYLMKGWFTTYKYSIWVKEADTQIELTYKGNRYCSLYFFLSACTGVLDNFLLNP
jgi:hypothetical protein